MTGFRRGRQERQERHAAELQPQAPTESAFDRIGGTPTVRKVVDRLYFWILRDDDLYLPYFREVNLAGLKAHMVSLLSHLLGGPRGYDGQDLVSVHAPLRITGPHYDRVHDYVMAALFAEHAPRDIIAAVDNTLSGLRADMTREETL